jgi:multiple sugar transport system substrate-binding protein
MTRKLKRRDFLKMMAGASGGALLASCAPKVVKETVVVEKPVEKVVKETVVVEKVVEKPVEKVVKETVVVEKSVEKVITATPSPRTVMRFQTWTDPGLGPMEQMMGVFEEEHPGLEVEIEPPGPGWPERTVAAFAAGTAPDLIDTFGDFFLSYADRGQLMDLQPRIDADLTEEQIADYHQGQYAMFAKDGKRYGLGKSCFNSAWVINKEIWDRFGAEQPTSDWDWYKVLEESLKITTFDDEGRLDTAGVDCYLINWIWSAVQALVIQSWGGDTVAADGITCLLDQPEALEALQFLQDCRWKDRIIPTPDDRDRMQTIGVGLLASGRVGMHRDGGWAIHTVLKTCDFPIDFIENPKGPTGGRSTFYTSDAYTINAATKAPDAAWEVLKFISADGRWSKMYIETCFYQPSKLSLREFWASTIREKYPRVENADLEVFTRGFDYARPEVRYCDQPTGLEILNPVIDEVFELNKRQATEAFAEVCPKMTAALKAACS